MRESRYGVDVICEASEDLFLEWEEVPEDVKDELDENGGVPCGGDGVMGLHCRDCRFGDMDIWEE